MDKRGTDKIISVYWFAILFIVAAAIVYMVVTFYGKPYDIRDVEADIMIKQIADCLAEGGYLKKEIFDNGNFLLNESNFLETCHLNFDVEDVYGWKEQGQYYVEVNFYEFDQNAQDGFGNNVGSGIVKGNVNLIPLVEVSKPKGKRDVDTVVIHYTANPSAQGAISSMKSNDLSAHYVLDRDGTILECEIDKESKIKKCITREDISEVEGKWEDKKAYHAGCKDDRPPCSGGNDKKPEPGEDCCRRYLNDKSIGIEVVNEGHACGGGSCETEGRGEEHEFYFGEVEGDKEGFCGIRNATCEKYPEVQIDALVDLVSGIVSRNNVPINRDHIIGHDEIDPCRKKDPGPAFNWTGFIEDLKSKEKLSSSGRSFYVLDKQGNQYIVKILALVGKTEKNVL